jgi:hypothetical protein
MAHYFRKEREHGVDLNRSPSRCAENGVPERGQPECAPEARELSVTPFEVCLKMLTSFATECIVSLLLHRLA